MPTIRTDLLYSHRALLNVVSVRNTWRLESLDLYLVIDLQIVAWLRNTTEPRLEPEPRVTATVAAYMRIHRPRNSANAEICLTE